MAWPYHTAAWTRLRLAKLADKPLCEVCALRGRAVFASVVDHIRAIAQGGDPFPALDGLMSLCPSCHGVKTAARDNPHAFGGGNGVAFKGCGTSGLPIDPDHPFNALSSPSPSPSVERGGGVRDEELVPETVVGHTKSVSSESV